MATEMSGQHHAPATLRPGETTVQAEQEDRWAPETFWTFEEEEKKTINPVRIRTPERPARSLVALLHTLCYVVFRILIIS
jgi:hypothetical protein